MKRIEFIIYLLLSLIGAALYLSFLTLFTLLYMPEVIAHTACFTIALLFTVYTILQVNK